NLASYDENENIDIRFNIIFDKTNNISNLELLVKDGEDYIPVITYYGILCQLEDGSIDTIYLIDDELIFLSELAEETGINECKFGKLKKIVKSVTKAASKMCNKTADLMYEAAPYVAVVTVSAAVVVSVVATDGAALVAIPAISSAASEVLVAYAGIAVGFKMLGLELGLLSDSIPESLEDYSSSNEKANKKTPKEVADDVLDSLEEDKKYGWNSDDLVDTLFGEEGAFNVAKNGELEKVKEKEYNKKKFTVYLGVFIENSSESYEQVGMQDEGSVVFQLEDESWDRAMSNHGGSLEGMWPLNMFFLSYCMSKDCDFMLVHNPDEYYNYSTGEMIQINGTYKSYSKELAYIRGVGKYSWNGGSNQPMQRATR
ncbi:MAG: hypothetical protein K6E20_07500, partial [Acholeplasmatales bacterium]|nr:hypothetical protein [Acholeplasmatales bacterium]